MLRTIRNLIVNIMAACIRDRDARHKFRNKYKIRSKFRKLRDDNQKILKELRRLAAENRKTQTRITDLERYVYIDRIRPLTYKDSLYKYSPPSTYISMACIAKNEGPYIKEWIEYHKIVGVERFYFYDNESTDQTKDVLKPYIEDGTVIYKYVTGRLMQMKAYKDAVYHSRGDTVWLALIDLDEYLVPVEQDNLHDVLIDYEKYPGLVVKWVSFDCNGHEKKPTAHGGLITANYTRVPLDYNCVYNRHFKSIVRPDFVIDIRGAHHSIYRGNRHAVNENCVEIQTGKEIDPAGSVNKIRINHYFSKSKEEYLQKMKRGYMVPHPDKQYKIDNPKVDFTIETAQDMVIQKYLPRLKTALGIKD